MKGTCVFTNKNIKCTSNIGKNKKTTCEFHTCIFPNCTDVCIGTKTVYHSNCTTKNVFVKFCIQHECPYAYPKSNIGCYKNTSRTICPY
jgi:hypothetical protein